MIYVNENFSENSLSACVKTQQALKFINYLTPFKISYTCIVYEIASMKDYHYVLMISIRIR